MIPAEEWDTNHRMSHVPVWRGDVWTIASTCDRRLSVALCKAALEDSEFDSIAEDRREFERRMP